MTPPARHTFTKQQTHMQLMDASCILYLTLLTLLRQLEIAGLIQREGFG